LAFKARIFPGRHDRPQNAPYDHIKYAARAYLRERDSGVTGRLSSTDACGRGITWTLTSSPTRRAAAAPASVAAFTAATSPRTMAVTNPAPIFSYPTRVTLSALTIASAASTMALFPLFSIIRSASIYAFAPLKFPAQYGGGRGPLSPFLSNISRK